MVHPARLGAPSAAAHPRWAEPSLLKRRGGTGRPAGPGAHAPSSPPRSQPPSHRPSAAPATAGLHGSGRLTELLPARAGHRPAGLRSPFRRCGAGRRGACARRGRTTEGGGQARPARAGGGVAGSRCGSGAFLTALTRQHLPKKSWSISAWKGPVRIFNALVHVGPPKTKPCD